MFGTSFGVLQEIIGVVTFGRGRSHFLLLYEDSSDWVTSLQKRV